MLHDRWIYTKLKKHIQDKILKLCSKVWMWSPAQVVVKFKAIFSYHMTNQIEILSTTSQQTWNHNY